MTHQRRTPYVVHPRRTTPALRIECLRCHRPASYGVLRGCCPDCYRELGDMVRAGITSWFKLVVAGKCLPSKNSRRRKGMKKASDVPNLGHLIEEGDNPGRDAIHIAVAPCVAGTEMDPGRSASAGKDGLYYEDDQSAIGIVDPFLKEPVRKGQRFWLFLYPNTITGLRHVWTHPAFATRVPSKGDKDDAQGS